MAKKISVDMRTPKFSYNNGNSNMGKTKSHTFRTYLLGVEVESDQGRCSKIYEKVMRNEIRNCSSSRHCLW